MCLAYATHELRLPEHQFRVCPDILWSMSKDQSQMIEVRYYRALQWEENERRMKNGRADRQRVTEKSNTLSSTDINWYLPQIFMQVSNQTSLDIVNAPMNCSVILISWHIIVIQSFYFSHKGTMNKDDSRGLVLGWKQVDFWSNEWKALQHSIFRILIYAFFLDMEVNF